MISEDARVYPPLRRISEHKSRIARQRLLAVDLHGMHRTGEERQRITDEKWRPKLFGAFLPSVRRS